MKNRNPSINKWELGIASDIIRKHESRKVFVEIGSRFGGSFCHFSQLMEPGATCVAIDLPGGPWGVPHSQDSLFQAHGELCEQGYDAHVIIGNSRSDEVVNRLSFILKERTIDLLFIDGDHTFKGVSSDIQTYCPMVKGIAMFHDCGLIPRGHEGKDSQKTRGVVSSVFQAFAVAKESVVIHRDTGMGLVWHDGTSD